MIPFTPTLQIHFMFPDGAIGYSCSRCDQRCCKTGATTFAASDRELLNRHPQLKLMVHADSASTNLLRLDTLGPSCYFLLRDGRCHLQVTSGYSAKPIACRLFPVSVIYELPAQNALLIGPHLYCPLALREDQPEHLILHQPMAAELRELLSSAQLPALPTPSHLARYPQNFLDLEAHLRDAAELATGDYLDFAAQQLVVSASFTLGRSLAQTPLAQELADARKALCAHLAELSSLFGFPSQLALSQQTLRCLLRMTGLLRLHLLMQCANEPYGTALERVPFSLITLAWLLEQRLSLQQSVAKAPADLTIQQVGATVDRFGTLALLLCHLGEVPYLEQPLRLNGLPEPLAQQLARFGQSIALEEQSRRASVGMSGADFPVQKPRPLRARLALLGADPVELLIALRALAALQPGLRFYPSAR